MGNSRTRHLADFWKVDALAAVHAVAFLLLRRTLLGENLRLLLVCHGSRIGGTREKSTDTVIKIKPRELKRLIT